MNFTNDNDLCCFKKTTTLDSDVEEKPLKCRFKLDEWPPKLKRKFKEKSLKIN
jgi:hypothetical protein